MSSSPHGPFSTPWQPALADNGRDFMDEVWNFIVTDWNLFKTKEKRLIVLLFPGKAV